MACGFVFEWTWDLAKAPGLSLCTDLSSPPPPSPISHARQVIYALTAAYRTASASFWVPTTARVSNTVHACEHMEGHNGGPLNGTRTCSCAKRVQVTCGGVPHVLSTRMSSAWPILSDPWFTNRILAPLSWWSNTQLENFYNVSRATEEEVDANPYVDMTVASRWGAAPVWDAYDWARTGTAPARPDTGDYGLRPETGASEYRPQTAASDHRTGRTGRASITWTNALPRTGNTRAQIKIARRRTSVAPMAPGAALTGVALHGMVMPSHGIATAPTEGMSTHRRPGE
jgi:hypothetical protein